jgi:hypothetical protein
MVLSVESQQWSKLRLGRVANINYSTQTCEVRFYDRIAGSRKDVLLAQPYLGRGWGILTGVEIGSIVVVGEELGGHIRILAYLPHAQFLQDDVNKRIDVTFDESPYRRPASGEIVLQSKANSVIAMNGIGDIILETPDGNTIELDREADLIFQQSSQHEVVSDAGVMTAGVVRRDVRGLEERALDAIFGGISSLGFDFDVFSETIGIDPQYPLISDLGGKNQVVNQGLTPGLFDPFFPKALIEGRNSGVNVIDMLNPAVTEWNMEIHEFGDGNPGVDLPILDDNAKKKGHVEPNVLAQITFGTLVNEVGRQLRFDYAFGFDDVTTGGQKLSTKGHGKVWKTGESTKSLDHHFDRNNTLKHLVGAQSQAPQNSVPGHNTDAEWTVDSLEQVPTAVLFRSLLHTKGADNFGRLETNLAIPFRAGQQERINAALQNSNPGSLWELQVDKEGLTKLNIPAATSINGLEPYRAGRSLLLNMDGDATIAIGRQQATGQQGLDRLTTVDFLNRNSYPNYGRRGRSLTLDLAGNLEAHIGADNNVNQSIMVQADGSCALFLGKELGVPSTALDFNNIPITRAAKAKTRKDRSLTARLEGNAELEVGHDTEGQQSVIISTTGGGTLHCGKDRDGRSLEVITTGGVHIQIQGPMKEKSYALHISADGELHIQTTGNIFVETEKKCHILAQDDISIEGKKNIALNAANNITLLAGSAISLGAPNVAIVGSDAGLQVGSGSCGIKCNSLNIDTLAGVSILGSLGVTGQVMIAGPGGSPRPVARVGDMVQAGPHIGQVISGSPVFSSI